MADYSKFTSTVTAQTYEEAVAFAEAETAQQAFDAFGNSNYQTGGASELKVKFGDNSYTATSILYALPLDNPAPDVSPAEDPELPDQTDPFAVEPPIVDLPTDQTDPYNVEPPLVDLPTTAPEPVFQGVAYDDEGNLLPGWTLDENNNPVYVGGDFVEPATAALAEEARTAARENAIKIQAQNQQTLASRLKTPSNGDWRVRISLAPNSDYLYNDSSSTNSILAPLKNTGGVIFPYTPIIETNYRATYDVSDLTHSNYRGYFYKNSFVDAVNIRGTFTAQDTKEATYLLAVIHFFRSVTKMFYGQDPAHRGSPPPLVYLSGLGQYQFNNHPSVVSNFTYSLPNDVDYVRVDPNNYGLNMLAQKTPAFSNPGSLISASIIRQLSAGIPSSWFNATPRPPSQSIVNQTVNSTDRATYVPTKMELSVTLLPVQSRRQVSQQFSFKDFANGNQLKGGFW